VKYILRIISPVIIIAGLYFLFRSEEIKQSPGILAPNKPIQKVLSPNKIWQNEEFVYTAVAEFELHSRVLSIRNYGSDDMSEFAPLDIAAGWQQMSDQKIIDKIDIKQQHRWYVWSSRNIPIPTKEIELNSSNIHIIPESEIIEDQLDNVIRGNIIFMSGYLVNVNSIETNRSWKTSTKRDDTGGGACEILWLKEITIEK